MQGTAGGCCDGNPLKSALYKRRVEGQVLPLSGLLPHAETDRLMENRRWRASTHTHTDTVKRCGSSSYQTDDGFGHSLALSL